MRCQLYKSHLIDGRLASYASVDINTTFADSYGGPGTSAGEDVSQPNIDTSFVAYNKFEVLF